MLQKKSDLFYRKVHKISDMKRNNGPGDQIDGKSDKNMQDLAQDDDNSVSEKVS